MDLLKLISTLEEIAPHELAEEMDYGKIGLIVPGAREVSKVATALDPTPFVIRKAADAGADALVVHHTLIWSPVTAVDARLAGALRMLLEADMSLYAMHTNYDKAPGGVNDVLAETLGLRAHEAYDLCRFGTVKRQSLRSFARSAARRLGTAVEVVGDLDREVAAVATAAGSAFRDALPVAKALKADVLLSSELRHDVVRDRGDVALIGAPHYYTEAPAMRRLAERLNAVVPAEFIDDPPPIEVIRP
jgi:dinuclear metal center YbgI/SA1388 family protein